MKRKRNPKPSLATQLNARQTQLSKMLNDLVPNRIWIRNMLKDNLDNTRDDFLNQLTSFIIEDFITSLIQEVPGVYAAITMYPDPSTYTNTKMRAFYDKILSGTLTNKLGVQESIKRLSETSIDLLVNIYETYFLANKNDQPTAGECFISFIKDMSGFRKIIENQEGLNQYFQTALAKAIGLNFVDDTVDTDLDNAVLQVAPKILYTLSPAFTAHYRTHLTPTLYPELNKAINLDQFAAIPTQGKIHGLRPKFIATKKTANPTSNESPPQKKRKTRNSSIDSTPTPSASERYYIKETSSDDAIKELISFTLCRVLHNMLAPELKAIFADTELLLGIAQNGKPITAIASKEIPGIHSFLDSGNKRKLSLEQLKTLFLVIAITGHVDMHRTNLSQTSDGTLAFFDMDHILGGRIAEDKQNIRSRYNGFLQKGDPFSLGHILRIMMTEMDYASHSFVSDDALEALKWLKSILEDFLSSPEKREAFLNNPEIKTLTPSIEQHKDTSYFLETGNIRFSGAHDLPFLARNANSYNLGKSVLALLERRIKECDTLISFLERKELREALADRHVKEIQRLTANYDYLGLTNYLSNKQLDWYNHPIPHYDERRSNPHFRKEPLSSSKLLKPKPVARFVIGSLINHICKRIDPKITYQDIFTLIRSIIKPLMHIPTNGNGLSPIDKDMVKALTYRLLDWSKGADVDLHIQDGNSQAVGYKEFIELCASYLSSYNPTAERRLHYLVASFCYDVLQQTDQVKAIQEISFNELYLSVPKTPGEPNLYHAFYALKSVINEFAIDCDHEDLIQNPALINTLAYRLLDASKEDGTDTPRFIMDINDNPLSFQDWINICISILADTPLKQSNDVAYNTLYEVIETLYDKAYEQYLDDVRQNNLSEIIRNISFDDAFNQIDPNTLINFGAARSSEIDIDDIFGSPSPDSSPFGYHTGSQNGPLSSDYPSPTSPCDLSYERLPIHDLTNPFNYTH